MFFHIKNLTDECIYFNSQSFSLINKISALCNTPFPLNRFILHCSIGAGNPINIHMIRIIHYF